MEILSPAGSSEHIEIAINEKSNAVYGGLKKWNARNNAVNFTIEEYNECIKKLHKENIKFYLTLNTLMLDEELKEILDLFRSGTVIFPDAFIVADIGLISLLKKEFPNIPLHISTQFGAHSLEDLNLLKNLGASRVVLARELTLMELNKLKDNTNLELETFIWGSQCLSFSGLCFFGTFINGGSGNRGKCSIICRDVYEVKGDKGTFLYVPDMNCINLIENLDGIASLKIEGRRRTNKELIKIINDIRNKHSEEEQKGYLYGDRIDENKMYEKINHRFKPVYTIDEIDKIDDMDVFVEFKDNVPYKFAEVLDKSNKNIKYIYSEYRNNYRIEKNNIFFVLDIRNQYINQIDYTNYKGEFKSFYMDNNDDFVEITINQLVHIIENLKPNLINVYKIRYIRNLENKYLISEKMLNELKKYVKEDNSRYENQMFNCGTGNLLESIYLETDDQKIVDSFLNDKFVKIIFNLESIEEFEEIEKKYKNNIIYKLPLFNWKSIDYKHLYSKFKNKEVMFTRLSQLEELKEINVKKRYVDYSIYCWNKESVNFMEKYDVQEYTASPELTYVQNNSIFKGKKVQYILAGKLPLVYTRACFKNIFQCQSCDKGRKNVKEIRNVSKELDFEIICKKDYRIITYNKPILNDYSKFNVDKNNSFRYVALNQTYDEIKETIDILKQKDFIRKLRQTKMWKNSYENNLIITRA